MDLPNNKIFEAGDLIRILTKDPQASKVHSTTFEGIVISVRGHAANKTFTVRKISSNVAIERIFAQKSPFIEKITLIKKGKARRSKLYYLRNKNVASKFRS